MSASEVGRRLVALVREGKHLDAVNELYAADVVSVEATAMPDGERVTEGIEGVRGKNQWWIENHEVHDASARGPFPHGEDRFCVFYTFDITNKPSGQRMQMEEVGLYTVEDGKVVREEFFYDMG